MHRVARIPMTWLIVLLALSASRVAAVERQPLPFLMAEDFEDLDFCAWRIEPGHPDPHNPLLEPAMPWDAGGVLAHATIPGMARRGKSSRVRCS